MIGQLPFAVRAALAAGLLLLFSSSSQAQNSDDTGLNIAQEKCGKCHATGQTDASLHAEAPPFRTLGARYPVTNLEEALAEGIVTGHPDMPEIMLEPAEIDALLGYLELIQP